jgi:hypothetical protein
MNRDSRTQPFPTEILPLPGARRDSTRVTEKLPVSNEEVRPAAVTEPALTQVYLPQSHLTELAITQPLVAPTIVADTLPAGVTVAETVPAHATPPAAAAPVAAPVIEIEPIAAVIDVEQPAANEPPPQEALDDVRPPTDSEPLRQIDRLTALVEQELRKSNPAFARAATTPDLPPSAEEESLQSYLDRFMERVTGKRPDPPPAAEEPAPEAEPAPAADSTPEAAADAPAEIPAPPPAAPQAREPAKPPECRQSLAAMRDLANENARWAVASHASRNLLRQAQLTMLAAGASSLVSTACAAWHLATGMPGALEGAVCAGILAGLLSCRFFLRCRRLTAPGGTA